MTTDDFIQLKAPQLAAYGEGFYQQQIPLTELRLYLWDTLEEWFVLDNNGEAQSDLERVFWFLLYSFEKWPEWALLGNQYLRQQLRQCCAFLAGKGSFPDGCSGVRPAAKIT